MKFACLIGIFLNSANLICRSTVISKCFRGSLRLRDNESRLYLLRLELIISFPLESLKCQNTGYQFLKKKQEAVVLQSNTKSLTGVHRPFIK